MQHFQQAIGHDAVQVGQARVGGAAAQQLEGFYRAVIGQEVIVAVVAPVHLRCLANQAFELGAIELERDRRQAAQLGLGVLINDLGQR
ncbi:hypothetical protein D3C77_519660 [compost metagenome]